VSTDVELLSDDVVEAYLARIGLRLDEITVDHDGLALLQYSHLVSVPFTNLDVFEREPVSTALEWSLPAVIQGRGGWCFVLNGAFASLLRSLGFDVTIYGALVTMGGTGDISPMDDHMCLRVDLDESWLVDVGFGESFTRPLALANDEPVFDAAAGRRFRLTTLEKGRRQLESEQAEGTGTAWRDDYAFEEVGRDLAYFTPANDYLANNPDLPWTQKRFSTVLTESGRTTVLADRVKFSPVGTAEYVETIDDAAWEAARRRYTPTPG